MEQLGLPLVQRVNPDWSAIIHLLKPPSPYGNADINILWPFCNSADMEGVLGDKYNHPRRPCHVQQSYHLICRGQLR